MKQKRHIIEKVFVDIDTLNEKEAYTLKDNIGNFLSENVFRELESLFDEHSRKDLITRFDRLEIEVSIPETGNLDMLCSEIVNRVLRKIEVADYVADEKFKKDPQSDLFKVTGGKARQIKAPVNRQDVFFFFLENGFLPWYAERDQLSRLLNVKEWNRQLENTVFLSETKQLLTRSENALKRMILQVPISNIIDFIGEIGIIKIADKEAFEKFLNSFSGDKKNQWINLLMKISLDDQNWKRDLFYLMQLYDKGRNSDLKSVKARSASIENTARNYFTGDTAQQYFSITNKEIKEFLMMFGSEQTAVHAERGLTQKESNAENDPTIISNGSNVEFKKEPLFFERDAGEIAVRNAGQVLFFPFLPDLFRHFNWLDKDHKIKKEHQFRALQTLHYCASGNREFFEAEMIIEKFLCGIPLNEPVPMDNLLNNEIETEVDMMLQQLIKNWTALKNTSPDGLRQMFIRRDGKLIQKDRAYKLIVERKAQDVLLEKLPWGISIVKLPWIRDLLFVEW